MNPSDRMLPRLWCGRHGRGFTARAGQLLLRIDRGEGYRKVTFVRLRNHNRKAFA